MMMERGISISEIIDQLKLSRNYITRNITHCVKHIEKDPSKGTRVVFDEEDFRDYLKNKATFTRQTKRINLFYEMEKYNKQFPEQKINEKNIDNFLGNIPNISEMTRSQLPTVTFPSFDFWDRNLIFPKEYFKGDESSQIQNSEICYRDMFDIGAVKIQLGKQKTMFCVVNEPGVIHPDLHNIINKNHARPDYLLVPADWEPFYKGVSQTDNTTKKISPFKITVQGNINDWHWHEIEGALRNSLILDRIVDYQVQDENFCVSVIARVKRNT